MAYSLHQLCWSMLLSAPLRVAQIAIVTVITFIVHWVACLFDKVDLPVPAPRSDYHAHEYRAPRTKGIKDYRSPCPALNTLANHGYLPRTGRDIRPYQFIQALQEGYNLTYPLAAFLTWGSFILVQQWKKMSLKDLARHNLLEHDASLAHDDAIDGKEYAPVTVDQSYLSLLLADAKDGIGLTAEDIAKARIRRESAYSHPLDSVHATIARGEMAVALNLFGVNKEGEEKELGVERLRDWWTYERLPADWQPTKRIGLLDTVITSQKIQKYMNILSRQKPHL